MLKDIKQEIDDLVRYRYVIYSFVSSTLKMRYKRSFLGFIWSLLGPILNYCVVGFVISRLAKFQQENYLSYVLFGSLTFNFFNASIGLGGSSLINNENYIRKIYLPKSIFSVSVIAMEFLNFILGLLAVTVVTVILGRFSLTWSLFYLPISLFIVFLFTLSIGLILSVAFVYFRDLMHVLPIVMQGVFFATPIIYPRSAVIGDYAKYIDWNPIYGIVELIRFPLVFGQNPPLNLLGSMFLCTMVLFIASMKLLKHFDNKIIFKL
jgi:ABC-type polysaccharide/polyol phosphate export permease